MFMTDPERRYRLVAGLNEASVTASPVYFTNGGAIRSGIGISSRR